MGSNVDASLLISRIERDYDLVQKQRMNTAKNPDMINIKKLSAFVLTREYYEDALDLAKAFGYSFEEVGGGLFKSADLVLTSPTMERHSFRNTSALVSWVKTNLCVRC